MTTTLSASDLFGDGDTRPNAMLRRVDVEDNLASSSSFKILSANQGRILDGKIVDVETTLQTTIENSSSVRTSVAGTELDTPLGVVETDPLNDVSTLGGETILTDALIRVNTAGQFPTSTWSTLSGLHYEIGDVLVSYTVTESNFITEDSTYVDFFLITSAAAPLRQYSDATAGKTLVQIGNGTDNQWVPVFKGVVNISATGEEIVTDINTVGTKTQFQDRDLYEGFTILATADSTSSVTISTTENTGTFVKKGDMLVFRKVTGPTDYEDENTNYLDYRVVRSGDFLREYETEGYLRWSTANGWETAPLESTAKFVLDIAIDSFLDSINAADVTDIDTFNDRFIVTLSGTLTVDNTVASAHTINTGKKLFSGDTLVFFEDDDSLGTALFRDADGKRYDFTVIEGTTEGINRNSLTDGNVFVGGVSGVEEKAFTVANLTDTNFQSIGNGDVLMSNGSVWENVAIPVNGAEWTGNEISMDKGGTGQIGTATGVLSFNGNSTSTMLATGGTQGDLAVIGADGLDNANTRLAFFSDDGTSITRAGNPAHPTKSDVRLYAANSSSVGHSSNTNASLATLQFLYNEFQPVSAVRPIPVATANGTDPIVTPELASYGFAEEGTLVYTFAPLGKNTYVQGRITGPNATSYTEIKILAPGYSGEVVTGTNVSNTGSFGPGAWFSVTVGDLFSSNADGNTDPSYDKTTYMPADVSEEIVRVYFGATQKFDKYVHNELEETAISIPYPGYEVVFVYDGDRWFMMG